MKLEKPEGVTRKPTFLTRVKVDSSSVAEVGYDRHARVLEVVFGSSPNKVYRYPDVPAEIFMDLLQADSIGTFFHQHVRNAFKHEVFDRNSGLTLSNNK